MLRGSRFKVLGIVSVFGAGLVLGLLLGQPSQKAPAMPDFSELKLKAMASHGNDNFAIATGPIDDDVEGLYMLDFLTGDLMCLVLNPKGGIAGQFKANVYGPQGFSAKKGKKGSFLIATGSINGGITPAGRLAGSVCYVVDSSSGEVLAFGFPWNKAATNTGAVQGPVMGLINKWQTRSVALP
jgi:hypothetical protein